MAGQQRQVRQPLHAGEQGQVHGICQAASQKLQAAQVQQL
jgi:hypothetical protein